MNFYNRYARGGSFGRKENAGSEFISPPSPAGLSSAAVVNKKKGIKGGESTCRIRSHRALWNPYPVGAGQPDNPPEIRKSLRL